jgi:methylphosphotriester-DNA--protein-cysteine methyltransferase
MIYVEKPPPASLAPWVECFWAVSDARPRTRREPDRVVPDGCPELILHLADPFTRKVGGRWVRQPRVFLAGTLTRPWLLRAGTRVRTLSVRFRPGGAAAVLGISLEGTADREVPLSTLAGPAAARALLASVAAARTTERRFTSLADWVGRRASAAAAAQATPVVDAIRRSRGQVRVDELARSLGWTPRRMQRAFAAELGIPPKTYARIVRLNAVLATLGEGDRAAAVDLALDAGYFDQAHLLRDFRELAGRTPRAGREADGRLARHFTDPERLRGLLEGD